MGTMRGSGAVRITSLLGRLIPKLRTMLDEPALKVRVAEAAAALPGLNQDPPEWAAADYKAALMSRFQLSD